MSGAKKVLVRERARKLGECIRLLWRPIIGVGLYCSLTTFAIQYPAYAPAWMSEELLAGTPFSVFPTAAYALAFLVVALLFVRKRIVPRGRHYVAGVATAFSLGAACNLVVCAIGPDAQVVGLALMLVGTCLMGAAVALLGVEWMRALADLGPLKTLVCMAISSFLVAAIFVMINWIPVTATLLAAAVFPWISIKFLAYPSSVQAKVFRQGLGTRVSVPTKLVITIFVQGLSAGIVQRVLDGGGSLGFLEVEAVGVSVAAIVALIAVWAFALDFNQLLYEVGFPLMALGYVALIALGASALGGPLLHESGNRFIMLMNWTLSAWIINQKGLSANWVYPCVMCSYLLGRQIGVVAGTFHAVSGVALHAIMAFVVLMCAIVMFGDRSNASGWGAFRPAEEAARQESSFDAACHVVARLHSLTQRECEILPLLARGRNRSYICERCSISSDTVKSHMRNIYQKLEVHSQQELVSMVERAEAVVGSDREVRDIPRVLL